MEKKTVQKQPAEEATKASAPREGLADLAPLVVGFALVVLAALLFSLRDRLSPVLLALALVLVLYPYRRFAAVRVTLGVVVLLLVLEFLRSASSVLMPFVLSVAFAYLFDPLVDAFEARRVPRTVVILGIDLVVLGGIVFSLIVLIPKLAAEVAQVFQQIIQQAPAVQRWFQEDLTAYLSRYGFDVSRLTEGVLAGLPDKLQELLQAFLSGLLSASSSLSSVLGQFLNLVLVPFITFYLLRDWDKLRHDVKVLFIPVDKQAAASSLWHRVDDILSGFVRGQLTVCVLVGALTAGALLLLGIRYWLALGILAGALNIVPYVGLAVTLLVAVLVGLFSPNPGWTVLKIVLAIEAVQVLESTVLTPRIVGNRVGLHPAWVILAVLVFANYLGVLGLFLAVPITAVTKELLLDALRKKRRQEAEAQAC